jgi:hypothetical protein
MQYQTDAYFDFSSDDETEKLCLMKMGSEDNFNNSYQAKPFKH